MGAARGSQSADEKPALQRVRKLFDEGRRLRVARVAVDDGEMRVGGRAPVAVCLGELADVGADGREHAEAADRQFRQHHADRRLVVILLAGAADAGADGADPVLDVGLLLEIVEDARQVLGEAVGDVQKAEIRARRGVVELRQATVGRLQPVGRMRVRGVEGVVAFHAGDGGEGAIQYTPKDGVGAAPARKP